MSPERDDDVTPPERLARRARTEALHPLAPDECEVPERPRRARRESFLDRTPTPFKVAAFVFGLLAAALSLGTVVYGAASTLATKAGLADLSEVRERLIRVESRLDGIEVWMRALSRRSQE